MRVAGEGALVDLAVLVGGHAGGLGDGHWAAEERAWWATEESQQSAGMGAKECIGGCEDSEGAVAL